MAKISYNPVDRGKPAPASYVAIRISGMAIMAFALVGVAYLLMSYGGSDEKADWDYNRASVRTNFDPILSQEEVQALGEKALRELEGALGVSGVGQPEVIRPGDGTDGKPPAILPPGEETRLPAEFTGIDQRDIWAARDEHDLRLAQAQLTRNPVFRLSEETADILDFEPFRDTDQTRAMSEFQATGGRQSPPAERLALQVLHKIAGMADYRQRVEPGAHYFSPGAAPIVHYRGRGFSAEGRLFDLRRIVTSPPYVLADGTRIDAYYEGIVALISRGEGHGEHPLEHRAVLFQCLQLPPELAGFVNDTGVISQNDALATQIVMVRFSGAYLRRWIFEREVAPFSSRAKRVTSQAYVPLLLTNDLALSQAQPHALDVELLQQVRDAMREDPVFLETEAAYYATLAKSAEPEDVVTPVEGIGYFDLAGSRGETGPRYRGQGVRVAGMIGDDYAPVVLPPNISGMRRVFRTLVVGDTGDMNSPSRYIVDMLEPPTGLEPRALVGFNARYYRNIFETRSTSSLVRPLLIVRRVQPLNRASDESTLAWGLGGAGAFVLMCMVIVWFVLSDRRERKAFEATSMAAARRRLEKRGGLKLKALPDKTSRDSGDNPG